MKKKSIRDVIAERNRQIEQEGFDASHDCLHEKGELAKAAAGYADHAVDVINNGDCANFDVPCDWPWADEWWKPRDPRYDLIRAAALILAEIDRIDLEEETEKTRNICERPGRCIGNFSDLGGGGHG